MLKPIYICGPTASGKSAFAIALAKKLGGEIINGDAYQVYRGIETLAASPSTDELAEVPHHLYNVIEPSQQMDAQFFRELALEKISELQSKRIKPIIVGGSGMYLKFLTHGPSPVPAGDDSLREKLEQRSTEELVSELQELDPAGASITNLQNRRYVIRALEICLLSGNKMSSIKNDWAKHSKRIDDELEGYVLSWDPEALRSRIHKRTTNMLENGAIEEVAALTNPSITCEKAIGVDAINSYLSGEIVLERCHELIYFATSQYAKRQRTWFIVEQVCQLRS